MTSTCFFRALPMASRAYYQDGQYLVSVRYPGQWNDIRDFVQPANPDVVSIYHQYGPDYWSLFDFVCRNIDYRRDIGEFWQTPSEVLRGWGDCEDTSILLTSLIRAGGSPDIYVALGSYQGLGHAWCQYRGEILESTFTQARSVSDPEHYDLYCLFNDQEVIELWPGALAEIFEVRREEATKLNLMAGAYENGISNLASWIPLIGSVIIAGSILMAASLRGRRE